MKLLKWTTIKEYVDVETGEKIYQKQVEREYIIIRRKKHINATARLITWTNQCRRRGEQLELKFD